MDNIYNLTPYVVTYQQLIDNSFNVGCDKYGMAHYLLADERRKVSLSNPFNESKDNPALFFIKDGDVVVGRFQFLSSRMKMRDEIIPCGTGSALEVEESYRKFGVGADIMTYFTFNSGYNLFLTAGISEMAAPLYKALKYVMVEFPHIICIYQPMNLLRYRGVNKWLYPLLRISDIPFELLRKIHLRKAKQLQKRFIVIREDRVPQWVDDIVLNDGHKYMEVHDSKWMQWNLENCFHADRTISRFFYSVKYKNKYVGFFYTTERMQKKTDDSFHYVNGFIPEWGTIDEKVLSEVEIYQLALGTFSKDVSVVNISSANAEALASLKKMGFRQRGISNIALKCDKKKYPDISDIKQWRVRGGYADTMFFQ